jgi:hypothetical protein
MPCASQAIGFGDVVRGNGPQSDARGVATRRSSFGDRLRDALSARPRRFANAYNNLARAQCVRGERGAVEYEMRQDLCEGAVLEARWLAVCRVDDHHWMAS